MSKSERELAGNFVVARFFVFLAGEDCGAYWRKPVRTGADLTADGVPDVIFRMPPNSAYGSPERTHGSYRRDENDY